MALATFLTAVCIAFVAAYYSIIGLTAIFPASFAAIVAMGVVLEIGKLLTAGWLHQNWEIAPKGLKYYLTGAVVVLMFITSMGIFGFLSKAHIDQGMELTNVEIQKSQIETSIQRENRQIERDEAVLAQLDAGLQRYIELGAVSKGLEARENQAEERESLQRSIDQATQNIVSLQERMAQIKVQVAAFEAEVGPLAYVAELIYGEDADGRTLDSAVRIVILIIIFVFDPLAVLLVIAASVTLKEERRKKRAIELIEKHKPKRRGRPPKNSKIA